MQSLEEIEIFLPKYLSPKSAKDLFEGLRQFPEIMDERLYLLRPDENVTKILQGDGLSSLQIIRLPDPSISEGPAMVISNSCDNDPANVKYFGSRLCYCPMLSLIKYKLMLLESGEAESGIESHLESIRKQRIAQVFYLPEGAGLEEEKIVFLSHQISCNLEKIYEDRRYEGRLFRLSNLGFYMFIVKLSIFLTRITEGRERISSGA